MGPYHRQLEVQYRHADGHFVLLRNKTPGAQTRTNERLVNDIMVSTNARLPYSTLAWQASRPFRNQAFSLALRYP